MRPFAGGQAADGINQRVFRAGDAKDSRDPTGWQRFVEGLSSAFPASGKN